MKINIRPDDASMLQLNDWHAEPPAQPTAVTRWHPGAGKSGH